MKINRGCDFEFIYGKDKIFIIPKQNDKPIKLVCENQYPCPVAYQLGFNRLCKYINVKCEEFEIDFTYTNIGCDDCFLEVKNEKTCDI